MIGAMLGLARGVANAGMVGMNFGAVGHVAEWAGKGLSRLGAARAGQGLTNLGGGLRAAGTKFDSAFNSAMNAGPKWNVPGIKTPHWEGGIGMRRPDSWKPYQLTVGKAMNHVGVGAMVMGGAEAARGAAAPQEPGYYKMASSVEEMAKQAARQDFADLMAQIQEAYHVE